MAIHRLSWRMVPYYKKLLLFSFELCYTVDGILESRHRFPSRHFKIVQGNTLETIASFLLFLW